LKDIRKQMKAERNFYRNHVTCAVCGGPISRGWACSRACRERLKETTDER
jgi:predicted nucleic acid-binding Zn ribbon protein